MNLEHWPIEQFVEYDRNPRKNDHAVDKMAAGIREYGFRVPMLVKSDGLVVDGHLRLKAARKLGLEALPVVLCDDMSETQIRAFRLSVNRLADEADWDFDLLKLEIEDLTAAGFDLDLTGFDLGEIGDLEIEFKEVTSIEGAEEKNASLAERFGLPPFSVLNAREGWWQDRKRAWLTLGIKSELGRGEDLANPQGATDGGKGLLIDGYRRVARGLT